MIYNYSMITQMALWSIYKTTENSRITFAGPPSNNKKKIKAISQLN